MVAVGRYSGGKIFHREDAKNAKKSTTQGGVGQHPAPPCHSDRSSREAQAKWRNRHRPDRGTWHESPMSELDRIIRRDQEEWTLRRVRTRERHASSHKSCTCLEPIMSTTTRKTTVVRASFASLATLSIYVLLAACANDASRAVQPSAELPSSVLASKQPELGACTSLTPPEGAKLAYHVYATGVQIYGWNGATWALIGPDAVLSADAQGNSVVGTHYVGPTWETNSGSKAVGAAIDRCTVDPNAVPWLSLSATSSGPGLLHGVTFIQRVNTVGGKAPSTPGTLGQTVRVPYSAEYFFYRVVL